MDEKQINEFAWQGITLAQPPKPVGYWVLYGGPYCTKFAMYSKPTEEQIANTTRLLGWVWEDA